ncbi:phenylacetaldehyde oxime monooxygenase CYP71AN24-like [Gossypium raimondii]|uniref:Cytochrome P450 n=1 Tax=Gossypium raimondii TaxID=29730 RepID=A0A7J8PIP4_GOSRA|nr:phenylacetaldehyde oxime monooxygenase CYP71AN24-like [Gossypium raimondii]MBA0589155.1 hypothetical protein [Gossypium raimondii]
MTLFSPTDQRKRTAADILLYGCKDLGFAPHVVYWKQIKKISVVELLNHQRVQSFQFVREEEVEVVIDKIRNVCLKGESINLTETLALVSNNIISRCVLSQKSEEDDDGQCNKFWSLSKRLMDMFLAGIDSSASTVEWTMAELLKHPTAMKKLQEEITYPVAPLLLPRHTSATVKVGGYDIPSNTTVLINAWAIQRQPKWWEKPEEFIPERFENNPINFIGEDFQFIPFGVGRRSCPGLQFGVASVEYMIANLVYCFDWKLADGATADNLDMTEPYVIAVYRKSPLHIRPLARFRTL